MKQSKILGVRVLVWAERTTATNIGKWSLNSSSVFGAGFISDKRLNISSIVSFFITVMYKARIVKLEEIIKELQDQHKNLKPILVLAPVQRCGTTLLQRAINAGGEAIIYGENFFMLEMHPFNIGAPVKDYESKVTITSSVTEAFLAGKRDIDATALFPDYQKYVQIVLNMFFAPIRQYDEYSEKNGYKNWGLKHQPKDLRGFNNFLNILPDCHIVVIYRYLLDVAKSFRARWPDLLENNEQLGTFATRWATNLNFLLNMNAERHVVSYEELIADKATHVDKLSEYLGVKVSLEEFDKKINAHFGTK